MTPASGANALNLPAVIRRLLPDSPGKENHVGLSGSTVLCWPDRVLKIEPISEESRNEAAMMRWLQGRVPVPELLAATEENGMRYLLMRRLDGRMLCDPSVLEKPEKLLTLAAEGLHRLWQTDVSGCPASRMLADRLQLARRRVETGLCSTEDAEPGTYGSAGFASPEKLLCWLERNRPDEEPVLTHGDCCLPNLFADENGFCGFIDLGRSGVGDKWQDIALLYRSTCHNYDGSYGYTARARCPADRLFDALGVQRDEEKLRYYILLDELF